MEILLLSCSYRRKAEELLWKKAFYDLIQKSKSNRQVHTCTEYNVLLAKCNVHVRIHVSYPHVRQLMSHCVWLRSETRTVATSPLMARQIFD